MSNFKNHILTATIFFYITIFLFALYNQPPYIILQWLLATLAGSLFPDIDIKSKGQKIFYVAFLHVIVVFLLLKNYNAALSISAFSFMPLFSKHRGLFHNIWFLSILIFIITKLLVYNFSDYQFLIISNSLFFSMGVITHLWLDWGFMKMFKFK